MSDLTDTCYGCNQKLPPQTGAERPVAAWTDGKGYVTTSKTIAEHHAANGEPMAPIVQPVAQPLTDEQIKAMWAQYCGYSGGILDFARAIRDVK